MAFLKSELESQKWLEAKVDVQEFIESQGISDTAMIYEIVMAKSVFKTKAEAMEWLQGKCYWGNEIKDGGTDGIFFSANTAQLSLDTSVTFDLRRGVVVKAADLKTVLNDTIISFGEGQTKGIGLSL